MEKSFTSYVYIYSQSHGFREIPTGILTYTERERNKKKKNQSPYEL